MFPDARTARIALAGAVFLAAACARRGAPPPAPASAAAPSGLSLTPEQRSRITVQEVREAPFHRTIESTGTVAFDQNASTQVIAGISGPVARVLTPPGTRVSAGQALAEVTSPDFASAVSGYRKSAASAANLRRIADLDKKLFDAGGISRREMQQAETEALSAEADRDASLAQLRSIGIPEATVRALQEGRAAESPHAVIRSPIAGTVVERLISPGQLLQAGTTACFTIADLSRVWVIANVFEQDVPFVSVGAAADVSAGSAEAPMGGTVEYVASLVDPSTRAIGVRVVLRNPSGLLKKDQYVRVAIHSPRESRGVLLPASAVLRDDENLPFVYVEAAGGSFLRRRIDLGSREGDRIEARSGVRAGDRVVVEGALFMQFAESQ
ncbi:MAG TPA: efflux RND transporter periplasmic adaptor subunit [Thermoanaerobaculia bacterium]|nr:efflux RND transporter periplasmic adaptor subunit [Thermoanaerobaculia bacterium]